MNTKTEKPTPRVDEEIAKLRLFDVAGWWRGYVSDEFARTLERELEELREERDAIRELMNVYNLGGWTDAIGPMKRALAAEQRLKEAEKELAQADKRLEELSAIASPDGERK